jgi:cobalt/nickel transport system permease protein
MITESFATGISVIHRIDPRLKIVFAVGYSFVVAVSLQFPVLFTALAASLVLVGLARLDVWGVIRRISVVLGFVLLIWAVLPLTFEGDVLMQVGPVKLMRPGVILSARITLKSIAISLTFMALVATMSIATLGHALNDLRLPDKMVFLLLITYRYFFVIEQEFERLIRTLKMRGFQPKTNLHTYKTYAYLIGILFIRASDRAGRVYQAMKCRGFNGKFYSLHTFPPHRRNVVFSSVMSLLVFGLVLLEWREKF